MPYMIFSAGRVNRGALSAPTCESLLSLLVTQQNWQESDLNTGLSQPSSELFLHLSPPISFQC